MPLSSGAQLHLSIGLLLDSFDSTGAGANAARTLLTWWDAQLAANVQYALRDLRYRATQLTGRDGRAHTHRVVRSR